MFQIREDAVIPKSISSINSALSASANVIKKPLSISDGLDSAHLEEHGCTKKTVSFIDGSDIPHADEDE